MKLYELGRDKHFRIVGEPSRAKFKLINIDGMYSFCYRISDMTVHHIAAFQEVEEIPIDKEKTV